MKAENESLLLALLNGVKAAIMAIDEAGKIVFVNEAAKDIIGHEPGEMIGMPALDYVHPEDMNEIAERLKEVFEGQVKPSVYRIIHADGSIRWVESTSRMEMIDGRPLVCSVVSDITEKMEKELQRAKIIEEMPTGFASHQIILDEQGQPVDYRFLQVNPAFERMTGLQESQVVDRTVKEILPTISQSWLEVYGRVAISGQTETFVQYNQELKRWFHVVAFSSKLGYFNCIITDVTEMKKLEARLLMSQKMQALGILTGGVAHEFNNNLAAILGYLRFCLEDASLPDNLKTQLLEVEKAGFRLRDIVRGLMIFSGRRRPETAITEDPWAVIQKAVDAVQAGAASLSIVIAAENKAGKIDLLTDESFFEIVIKNLLDNALKAIKEAGKGGEISVKMSLPDAEERIMVQEEGHDPSNFVVISVEDSGIGINEAEIPNIFTPFHTTREVGKGVGLGLAMIYGIATQAGGFVRIQSQRGKGTLVKIFFPCRPGVEQDQKMLERLQGRRVALIGDLDDILLSYLKMALERKGCVVVIKSAPVDTDDEMIPELVILKKTPFVSLGQQMESIRDRWPDVAVLFVAGQGESLDHAMPAIKNAAFVSTELNNLYRAVAKLLG